MEHVVVTHKGKNFPKAHFGQIDEKNTKPWVKVIHTPDDDELRHTPKDVIDILGFDVKLSEKMEAINTRVGALDRG
jgi:hypothetical protein